MILLKNQMVVEILSAGGWNGSRERTGTCESLCGVRQRTDEGARACRSREAVSGLLRRSASDRGPAQRRADGGGDGSGTRFDAASEALAPCRQFPVVG